MHIEAASTDLFPLGGNAETLHAGGFDEMNPTGRGAVCVKVRLSLVAGLPDHQRVVARNRHEIPAIARMDFRDLLGQFADAMLQSLDLVVSSMIRLIPARLTPSSCESRCTSRRSATSRGGVASSATGGSMRG